MLDRSVADRPLLLSRVCCHISYLNTRAMELLNLNRDVDDPPGGRFERNPSGELTGRVEETAQNWVLDRVPGWSPEEVVQGIEKGQQALMGHGICAACTIPEPTLPRHRSISGDIAGRTPKNV